MAPQIASPQQTTTLWLSTPNPLTPLSLRQLTLVVYLCAMLVAHVADECSNRNQSARASTHESNPLSTAHTLNTAEISTSQCCRNERARTCKSFCLTDRNRRHHLNGRNPGVPYIRQRQHHTHPISRKASDYSRDNDFAAALLFHSPVELQRADAPNH